MSVEEAECRKAYDSAAEIYMSSFDRSKPPDEGPILDIFRRQLNCVELERNSLKSRCSLSEDKLDLLKKQLEANEKHRSEYLKRYEEAISDKEKISKDYTGRITDLQSKYSKLEERCLSLSNALELARRESSDWKNKYNVSSIELKAVEDKFKAQVAALQARIGAAEGRLTAVREQAASAQEEALEWKRKYDVAVGDAKTALERAAVAQERTNKKAAEAELKSRESESLVLKEEIRHLLENLESVKTIAQSHERQVKILEQEKNHLQEKYLSECKKFDETDKRCKDAERDARKATELADVARAEAVAAQKEKSESQRLAMERLALIEKAERQVENLERDRYKLIDEIEGLRQLEIDAIDKAALLESRVQERETEIEEMLSQNNEQRSKTVHVLESLLATERAARAEANNRAESLSLQLQVTQGKLDSLQQELTSVRLNETALDTKLRNSRGKRPRVDDNIGTESVHDMDIDEEVAKGRKRSKSTTSPFNHARSEDGGSVFRGAEDNNPSQGNQESEAEDYKRFTVVKLKQELTKHGFGAQLLELRNPNKKDILALYEKHVIHE
ncbi:hypothetical protein B296_00011994 [Ensete ventricosum]|uniref:Guanylate-binding protein/Atlastin C-terminal domain-containing protein n=1 Tax=Ensete ventricosum TaxID=4639 RepID=A0A426ZTY0_ENSVE|nr:hypothetical protein B296_00011994 [Ensete ventricosum]